MSDEILPSEVLTAFKAIGKVVQRAGSRHGSALHGLEVTAAAFAAVLDAYALPNAENPEGMCSSPLAFRKYFAGIIIQWSETCRVSPSLHGPADPKQLKECPAREPCPEVYCANDCNWSGAEDDLVSDPKNNEPHCPKCGSSSTVLDIPEEIQRVVTRFYSARKEGLTE